MSDSPLTDIDHHLQDDTPATRFVKESLQSEELVVFTDSAWRDTFLQTKDIMKGLEQKWKPVVLNSDELKELKPDIEELLNKITNSAVPPHMFIRQKYFSSGRTLMKLFAHGYLEQALGLEVALVH